MRTDSDAELLRRAQTGDRDALDGLWRKHRRWLAAVLLLHAGRASDVDDLLQETAAAFVAKIGSLRDPETLPGWLRTIALNAARMQARSGSRRRAAIERFAREGGHASTSASSAPEAAGTDAVAKLRERLATLPTGYAEPLLLRLVHDLSYARIAEILDLPETTVENRIVRGRRLLREQAAADLGLEGGFDGGLDRHA